MKHNLDTVAADVLRMVLTRYPAIAHEQLRLVLGRACTMHRRVTDSLRDAPPRESPAKESRRRGGRQSGYDGVAQDVAAILVRNPRIAATEALAELEVKYGRRFMSYAWFTRRFFNPAKSAGETEG